MDGSDSKHCAWKICHSNVSLTLTGGKEESSVWKLNKGPLFWSGRSATQSWDWNKSFTKICIGVRSDSTGAKGGKLAYMVSCNKRNDHQWSEKRLGSGLVARKPCCDILLLLNISMHFQNCHILMWRTRKSLCKWLVIWMCWICYVIGITRASPDAW